jgi:hypothetical protein
MVARGLYAQKGISPPEYVGKAPGCWDFIRKELAMRGIHYAETQS